MLTHHELCFGCGRTNLFGLLLDVEPTADDRVAGRCFIKQDHQGADLGSAHEGVIAAALSEAMALALSPGARAISIQIEIAHRAPVGSFVEIEAHAESAAGSARARATVEGLEIATATGTYTRS